MRAATGAWQIVGRDSCPASSLCRLHSLRELGAVIHAELQKEPGSHLRARRLLQGKARQPAGHASLLHHALQAACARLPGNLLTHARQSQDACKAAYQACQAAYRTCEGRSGTTQQQDSMATIHAFGPHLTLESLCACAGGTAWAPAVAAACTAHADGCPAWRCWHALPRAWHARGSNAASGELVYL
jgi:hypothetical protein